jgi:hypothetical protein
LPTTSIPELETIKETAARIPAEGRIRTESKIIFNPALHQKDKICRTMFHGDRKLQATLLDLGQLQPFTSSLIQAFRLNTKDFSRYRSTAIPGDILGGLSYGSAL